MGLPDEHGRLKILEYHTATMRKNGKMAPDVDLKELSVLTKNCTEAQIVCLIKGACSVAMIRLIGGHKGGS